MKVQRSFSMRLVLESFYLCNHYTPIFSLTKFLMKNFDIDNNRLWDQYSWSDLSFLWKTFMFQQGLGQFEICSICSNLWCANVWLCLEYKLGDKSVVNWLYQWNYHHIHNKCQVNLNVYGLLTLCELSFLCRFYLRDIILYIVCNHERDRLS